MLLLIVSLFVSGASASSYATIEQMHNLPHGILEALCKVESNHRPHVVNPRDGKDGQDSLGECQIKEATARHMGFKGTRKQLFNRDVNRYYAGKYLAYQINRCTLKSMACGSVLKGITAYNKGHFKGTIVTEYVRKVLAALDWGE